jgi:ATP-dependent DNA ligase
MRALKTTAHESSLRRQPVARGQARAPLGQVVSVVSVTVGFTALALTRAHQLEGIVAKRVDAPYTPAAAPAPS